MRNKSNRLVQLMVWMKAQCLLSEGLTRTLPIYPGPHYMFTHYCPKYILCHILIYLTRSSLNFKLVSPIYCHNLQSHHHLYHVHQEVCSSWVAHRAQKKRTGGKRSFFAVINKIYTIFQTPIQIDNLFEKDEAMGRKLYVKPQSSKWASAFRGFA